VAGLPPRQRAAVVLRYFADLSVAETAAAMGCAQGTIKALTSQGLGTLRSRGGLTEFQETRDGA
jgi:RNA polymerase sigma factor (sigma-70 family)